MVLPQGIVGWWRDVGWERILRLLGRGKYATTYPSLEEDPEVQQEREQFEQQ